MSRHELTPEQRRRGGKRSAEARRKPRSPLEVLRRRFARDPEATFDEMSRTVHGMKLLEKLEEDVEREQPSAAVANPDAIARGWPDLVRYAIESGIERALFGFELTLEQRALVLAGTPQPDSPESRSSSKPSGTSDTGAHNA